MLSDSDKKYWKGIEERDSSAEFCETLEREFPELPVTPPRSVLEGDLSRRSFLRAAGFSLAATTLGACSRGPIERAIPLLVDAEESVVGRALWYASSCRECPAGCGILVKTRDGRPIKIEGSPQHPVSGGGVCAAGQASLLGLYDSHRLATPLRRGEPATWQEIDSAVMAGLEQTQGAIVILTGSLSSPTTGAQIGRFLTRFPNSRHVRYDPSSCSAILEAHQQTHGRRVLPRYHFERAETIVAFDADFLGTWISPVEFTRAYVQRRNLNRDSPTFSRHIHLEARMSLTGSNADRRLVVSARQQSSILMGLAVGLAGRAGIQGQLPWAEQSAPGEQATLVDDLVEQLWAARGRSLVVMGRNQVPHQRLVNLINHLLGNYGATLDIEQPSHQYQPDDRQFEELVEQMRAGGVGALIVAGVNPVYSSHRPVPFAEVLARVPLTVCVTESSDETAEGCEFVCPAHHSLESWGDGQPVAGLYALSQPTCHPLGDSRSLAECLSAWSGEPQSDLDMIRAHWRDHIFPAAGGTESSFEKFWNSSLHDGFVLVESEPIPVVGFEFAGLAPLAEEGLPGAGQFSLQLYRKIPMLDGNQAGNPWLQELPDPITKVTWDNYVSLSPALAGRLQVNQGDVLRVTMGEHSVELPALLQVGQHPEVVAMAVGYGRNSSRRFSTIGPHWLESRNTIEAGETVGRNVFPFAAGPGLEVASGQPVSIQKTGRTHPLALTQTHHNIREPEQLGGHRRDLVRETTLEEYRRDPAAGNPPLTHSLELWAQDHVYTGRHWAMAIDLNACTGCSACVLACQAENNVPVVGKDEVRRRREMHWIRIDRYYSGSEEDPEVMHQPVMCQHCDHAPCEGVCPVLATVHSAEGINQQIYNRCVGTRYCANNCPYKVRRFNWFDYWQEDAREHLVLNPDITTRTRGVMEKCSLCTQRIQEAKFEAKREGRELADREIQTACQQSCPAQAIVFGDRNDPESAVSRLIASQRHYRLLEEMNFRPSVGYLTKVRNKA